MEITEVRIKLMENSEDRLRAFCSITFDQSFVVRDLKIIEGNSGPFVAMPSRKLSAHCRSCNSKNHLRARYCNHCGERQGSGKFDVDDHGRAKLYADIAHPINAESREQIQERVIGEFHDELERAKEPGYVSRYDDEYNDNSHRSTRKDSQHQSVHGAHAVKSTPAKPVGQAARATAQTTDSNDPDPGFGNGIF